MNHRKELVLSITCFLLAFLLTMIWKQDQDEALAARISPEVIRFHVLANSDERNDQELKLEVKSLLLDAMAVDLQAKSSSHIAKEEVRIYIQNKRESLENLAEAYMRTKGYDYQAHMELTTCYFPTKTYGDMVFPCGTYEAVRVTLGSGEGRNWWCVLYPPLCFVDSTYAIVPDSSKQLLEENLAPEDFQALLTEAPRELKVELRLKCFDIIMTHNKKY